MSSFVELDVDVVAPESLTLQRARALLHALESVELPYVSIVSTIRGRDGTEGVIIDAEVELGQEPHVPILRRERIAIVFTESDRSYPVVYSLRKDFPQVPHREFPVGVRSRVIGDFAGMCKVLAVREVSPGTAGYPC